MQLKTERIETKRLILRPFMLEDAHALFANWGSDPEVTKFVSWPRYTEEKMAEGRMHYMQDCYAKGEITDWAIELKELGQAIGSIGVVGTNERVRSVEVGYCIGSSWWNQGITTEAFGAVIRYFFDETEVCRVEARHDTRNPASGAVMKKCGMLYEGTLRSASWNHSGVCDLACYGILKSDYQKEQSL